MNKRTINNASLVITAVLILAGMATAVHMIGEFIQCNVRAEVIIKDRKALEHPNP